MGFLNSSCAFTRFRILDTVTDDIWINVGDKLKQHCFKDIDNIPEVQSSGWVCFDDMLDTEWNVAPPQKGEYVVFSLRLDTRHIPAAVAKKYLTIAFREEMQKNDKKFIARERKKEIKERVLLQLRQRFLPVPATFDVIWFCTRNELWFASTRQSMIDLFTESFLQTFNLHLEQMTPSNIASALLDEKDIERLERLDPTSFTTSIA